MPVSFIPMADVSEGGQWLGGQVRPLREVSSGFTAFADEDVLVAKITPCFENGKGAHVVGLINGVGFGSTEFHVLRARHGTSPRFVHHLVQGVRLRWTAEAFMSGSAGQRRVPPSFFEEYPAPDLDYEEQVAVSRVLDTLDTTIRQTEAIIEKLKQVKQGLLHDLLTRGIADNGELRPPQSEAPHLYKESALGWIPKAWDAMPMRAACSTITKGTTPAVDQMWQGDEGIRFLRVDNLSFDGRFDFAASNFRISPDTHTHSLGRSRCYPGDVLTNIVGPPLGKLGLITSATGEVNINQAIALFRPSGVLLPAFVLLWLGSALAQTWLRQRAKQTSGQVNLTLALCQELPVLRMGLEEQQRVIDRTQAMQNRLTSEDDKLTKLLALKTGLMDDLLTGRVRVTSLLLGAPA